MYPSKTLFTHMPFMYMCVYIYLYLYRIYHGMTECWYLNDSAYYFQRRTYGFKIFYLLTWKNFTNNRVKSHFVDYFLNMTMFDFWHFSPSLDIIYILSLDWHEIVQLIGSRILLTPDLSFKAQANACNCIIPLYILDWHRKATLQNIK